MSAISRKRGQARKKVGVQGKNRRQPLTVPTPARPLSSYLNGDYGVFIVFDLETTGLSPYSEIVEIAACVCADPKNVFQTYILPNGEIEYGASNVNKLTKENGVLYFKNKPVSSVSFSEGLENFAAWIEEASRVHNQGTSGQRSPILVAHNCRIFDSQVLLNAVAARASDVAREKFNALDVQFGDSMTFFKAVMPTLSRHSLQNVFRASFGRSFRNAHQATTDVNRLADVLRLDKFKHYDFGSHVFPTKEEIIENPMEKALAEFMKHSSFDDELLAIPDEVWNQTDAETCAME